MGIMKFICRISAFRIPWILKSKGDMSVGMETHSTEERLPSLLSESTNIYSRHHATDTTWHYSQISTPCTLFLV